MLAKEWERTASLRPYVESQVFVVMPNHFHALFTLLRDGMFRDDAGRPRTDRWDTLIGPERQSVGAIVRAFKSAVTRRARMDLGHQGRVWQRNYYEHIIGNDRAQRSGVPSSPGVYLGKSGEMGRGSGKPLSSIAITVRVGCNVPRP